MAKSLQITWRDEAYGPLSYVGAAFRVYDYGRASVATVNKIRARYQAAGFAFDNGRASWIAASADDARRLVADLEGAGWSVKHAGRWPDGPPA